MPFLEMKDGVVSPTEEGNIIPAVQRLYNSDKTEGKKFFKDCLLYVFLVYNQEGVYKDRFENFRKKMVIERHLPKRNVGDFENNLRVVDLINEYLDRQMTKTERFLYQLEKDMEGLLNRVSNVPYTKIVKAKIPHVNGDGETTMIPADVEIDNSAEKENAIKLGERMIDYGEKLRNKILKEKVDEKKSLGQRLFDKKRKE